MNVFQDVSPLNGSLGWCVYRTITFVTQFFVSFCISYEKSAGYTDAAACLFANIFALYFSSDFYRWKILLSSIASFTRRTLNTEHTFVTYCKCTISQHVYMNLSLSLVVFLYYQHNAIEWTSERVNELRHCVRMYSFEFLIFIFVHILKQCAFVIGLYSCLAVSILLF